MAGPLYPASGVPLASASQGPAYPGRQVGDSVVVSSYNPYKGTAVHVPYEVQVETKGLIAGNITDWTYGHQFVCLASLAVGDPVRFGGENTVVKANSITKQNSYVVGFVRHKGTLGSTSDPLATTCYIQHFRRLTALGSAGSDGLIGGYVFLTDTGGFSPNPGTYPRILGNFTDNEGGASICALPIPAAMGARLEDLNDVNVGTLASGYVLQWNGFVWVAVPSTGVGGEVKIQASDTFGYLKDKVDAATIVADLVNNWIKVPSQGIAYANIQNTSATDVIIGRSSAGGGTVQEIACPAAGRTFLAASTVAAERHVLLLDTGDSPTFTGLTLTSTLTGAQMVVVVSTAGVGSPLSLTAAKSRQLTTNTGAGAECYYNLPTAAAGLVFSAYVDNANGLRLVAGGSDVIQFGSSASSAGGYINSTTIGSMITLVGIAAAKWACLSNVGTWATH